MQPYSIIPYLAVKDAAATVYRRLQDRFDGVLRTEKLIDPFGNRWMLAERKAGLGGE